MFPKIKDTLKFAWRTLWKNPIYFIGIAFAGGVINWLVDKEEIPFLLKLLGLLIIVVLNIAMMRTALYATRGEDISWSYLFNMNKNAWAYIKTYVVYQLIIIGGLILLIVPGFIFLLTYAFAPIMSLDKGIAIKEALKKSKETLKNNKIELFGLFFVLVLINILGALAFGIGILITYPLAVISYMFVYDRLTSQKPEVASNAVAPQPVEIPVHTGAEHEGENPHQSN